jgi:beta-xylosidase
MKKFSIKKMFQIMLVCGVGAVSAIQAATVTNPFLWADIPDLAIVRVDDKYYMTHTTMHMAPGVPIMESDDMVHWKTVGYTYQTLANSDVCNLGSGQMYGKGSWASCIRYKDGTFYVLTPSYTTNKTHLYSTNDIKNGPWKEVQLPFYHDPSLVLDDDGKNYVVYGSGDIKIVELNADLSGVKSGGMNKTLLASAGSVAGSSFTVAAEGSHVYKYNGYYYVFNICWPSNGMRTQICHRSKSLSGTFEAKVVLKSNGVAQGSIIQMKDNSWMGYLFQDNGSVGRSPWLMPVTWQDDWPVFNNGTAPTSFNMSTVSSGDGTGFVTSDDFSDTKLKLEWQFNHNPDNANWSLSAKPGYYRITTSRVDANITKARNTLTQRSFGSKCSGRIALDASGMKDGDIAGLSAFMDNYGFVAVKKTGTALSIVKFKGTFDGTSATSTQETSVDINQNRVYLRVDMDFSAKPEKATFYYSLDSTKWNTIGTTLEMSYTLKMFMGYRFALFNYATKSFGGTADFDWFQIGSSVDAKLDLYPGGTQVSKMQNQLHGQSFGLSCIQQPGASALTIGYQLTKAGHMSLALYDTRGALVDRISDRFQEAGSYSINHQVSGLANGRYMLTGMLDGKVFNTHPVLLMK